MSIFFGQIDSESTSEYRNQVLNGIFNLMYYGGFTYTEARDLPIYLRSWFIKRINEEFEKHAAKDGSSQSRGSHENTPVMNELKGKSHSHEPARMRRFT